MYIPCYHLQVLLNDGKTERVILAHQSGLEASQKAITEYRVLGPMISGCSWIELRPVTGRKHQVLCCVLSPFSISKHLPSHLPNVNLPLSLMCVAGVSEWSSSLFYPHIAI